MVVDLKIAEARLEEFEAWFDKHNKAPAKRETISFAATKSGDVEYSVRVTVRSQSAADALKEQEWGRKG